MGGRNAHLFVAHTLGGPSLRSTQRALTDTGYPIHTMGYVPELIDRLIPILDAWGIRDVPLIIAEDASALQRHVDVLHTQHGIYVFGLCGGAVEVRCSHEWTL